MVSFVRHRRTAVFSRILFFGSALAIFFIDPVVVHSQGAWRIDQCPQAVRQRVTTANEMAAWAAHCVTIGNEAQRFGILLRHVTPPSRRHLIVLVHGWRGDPISTWGKLPEVFFNPTRHHNAAGWAPQFDVLTYGYETGINKGDDLETEAKRFADLLTALGTPGRLSVTYQRIVIIAHSMGGLLTQRAALMMLGDPIRQRTFESTIHGVIYIAVPNELPKVNTAEGSKLLRWAAGIYPGGNHTKALAPYSDFRDVLSRAWEKYGQEQTDRFRRLILDRSGLVLATADEWVDPNTMGERFKEEGQRRSRMYHAVGQGHTEAVSISHTGHSTFPHITEFVRQFIPDLEELPRADLRLLPEPLHLPESAERTFLVHNASPAPMLLHWEVVKRSTSVTWLSPEQGRVPGGSAAAVRFEMDPADIGAHFIEISNRQGVARRLRIESSSTTPRYRVAVGCFHDRTRDPMLERYGVMREMSVRLEAVLTEANVELVSMDGLDACKWQPEWLSIGFGAVVVYGEVSRQEIRDGPGRYAVNFMVQRRDGASRRGVVFADDLSSLLDEKFVAALGKKVSDLIRREPFGGPTP